MDGKPEFKQNPKQLIGLFQFEILKENQNDFFLMERGFQKQAFQFLRKIIEMVFFDFDLRAIPEKIIDADISIADKEEFILFPVAAFPAIMDFKEIEKSLLFLQSMAPPHIYY